MDVLRHGLVGQRLEFVPRPACRGSASTADREVPRRERRARCRTGRQDGEVPRFVLAGREPACDRRGLSAAAKSSGDEPIDHGPLVAFACGTTGALDRAPVEPHQNPARPCGLLYGIFTLVISSSEPSGFVAYPSSFEAFP